MEMEVLKYVAAGIAMFGMIGAGIGVGIVFGNAAQGVARNPSADAKIFKNAIIGGAMAEALGILAFAVAMIILFV